MTRTEYSKGLAGVIAGETAISQVQGDVGRLIYRGIPIEVLAERASFEEATHFLLRGTLPTPEELQRTAALMRMERNLPEATLALIGKAPTHAHPMAILQAAVATWAFDLPSLSIKMRDEQTHQALVIISRLGTAAAAISRHRRGLAIIPPRMDLTHAENFLYMISGHVPDAETARLFEKGLILHMDHDFNASTFTARVIASTEATLVSSISGAVGALSGPLHGGANEKVMAMVDAIVRPENAREWVRNALATGGKVMGFGHRVYRTTDPRAVALRSVLERLASRTGETNDYEILSEVHDAMIAELSKKEKDFIRPNVDFWSGAFYRLLKLESPDFTPIFAVARVVGWCAHCLENWSDNRIFRPAALYVGPVSAEYPIPETVTKPAGGAA
jgi:citrate synthase